MNQASFWGTVRRERGGKESRRVEGQSRETNQSKVAKDPAASVAEILVNFGNYGANTNLITIYIYTFLLVVSNNGALAYI